MTNESTRDPTPETLEAEACEIGPVGEDRQQSPEIVPPLKVAQLGDVAIDEVVRVGLDEARTAEMVPARPTSASGSARSPSRPAEPVSRYCPGRPLTRQRTTVLLPA